jgi:hypothetical protein
LRRYNSILFRRGKKQHKGHSLIADHYLVGSEDATVWDISPWC